MNANHAKVLSFYHKYYNLTFDELELLYKKHPISSDKEDDYSSEGELINLLVKKDTIAEEKGVEKEIELKYELSGKEMEIKKLKDKIHILEFKNELQAVALDILKKRIEKLENRTFLEKFSSLFQS